MAPLKLQPWHGRALAIALLLAVLAAAAAALALLSRDAHRRYDAVIAERLDQLARYRRVIASRADYQQAIEAVQTAEAGRFYLKSSSPALAAADIQQLVQGLAEANGMRTESMQIVPHKDQDGYRRIAVNLRLRGKLAGVRALLHALEGAQPYLFVDNLSIHATVRSNYVPVPAVEPDVMAQFDLSGYALMKKSSNAAPRR